MPLSCTPPVNATHLKDAVEQMDMYEALIDNDFSVNTTMSEEFVYLVWKESQEEVVLQVEGILVEAHHPPVVSNGTEYSFVFYIGKLNDLIQSIVIVANNKDNKFKKAVQGLEAITAFMAWFNRNVHTGNNFTLGDLKAIHGQTCLLTPSGKVHMATVDIAPINSGNALKNMLAWGSHQYTEDNVVSYLKWEHKSDRDTLVTDMNPALLKPGHIVDLGLSFHLISFNHDSIHARLWNGEILKAITQSPVKEDGCVQGPPKKHCSVSKGNSMRGGTIDTAVDGILDMMAQTST
ncbi:hypothetical protein F5146DRAFT_1006385 [Armillaria mellea]|nr:hypothetical protein F5146DRAFT_1006385 [Armillaria mellea]